jgi:hypothetical protein
MFGETLAIRETSADLLEIGDTSARHLVQRLCNGLLVPELKKVPPSRGLLRL